MPPEALSASDAISLALNRTKRSLFQPFRLAQWMRISLVALLSSELALKGCGNFGNLGNFGANPRAGGKGNPFPGGVSGEMAKLGSLGLPQVLAIVAVVAVALFFFLALSVLFLYVYSRFRFILMDTVLFGECRIRQAWNRYRAPGRRFFWVQLLFFALLCLVIGAVLGVRVALMIKAGAFKNALHHPLALVGTLAIPLLVLIVLGLIMALALLLLKDFVVPVMAFEDIGVRSAFEKVWRIASFEKGGFFFYILLKIILTIAAAIASAIVFFAVFVVLLIPTVIVGILVAAVAKSTGALGMAIAITAAILLGSVGIVFLIWLIAFISVPAAIFFESYALYFFGARYPLLGNAMNPVSPASAGSPPSPNRDIPPIGTPPSGNPDLPPMLPPDEAPDVAPDTPILPGPDLPPEPSPA